MMTLSEIQAWVAEQPSLDAETLLKAKAHVIAYWNTLQDGTAEYTEARLYYESLMAKAKANAGVTPEMKKAKLVLDGLCEQGQLSLLVEQIGPVVAMGHVKSLEEVLATICAVQRGTVLTMAAKSLGSQGEIEAFTMLLDQKIKAKIEARLKGTKGELYKAAYAEAVAKYGGALPVQAETTPVVAPAKKKKVKPVAKSTWVDVSDSMVLVPKTIQGIGPAFHGNQVLWISTQLAQEMAKFTEDEKARWVEQGIEPSELLLRHNYLTMLFQEWGAQGCVISACGNQQVAICKIGEEVVEGLHPKSPA